MAKKITQNVNKDKFFNDLPQVKVPMSSWINRHTNYQSSNLGQIVPIYYEEVLPKERKEIKLGMISHTTTPIAPIFNALYTEIRTFFVPHRLSADLLNGYKDRKSPWVKVFGEDNVSSSAEIVVPLVNQRLPIVSDDFGDDALSYTENVTSDDNIFNSLDLVGIKDDDYTLPNYLNLAAYELIYQRHYRNENLESSTYSNLYRFLFNAYNRSSNVSLGENFYFEMANREKDYFTGAKPFTQKGDAPIVNIGTEADIVFKASDSLVKGDDYDVNLNIPSAYSKKETKILDLASSDNPNATLTAFADLTTAKGLSINELRLLIKTQELLEKDAMYGSRYAESLNSHFGTAPLDLTLQEPQELFRTTITSQMQAIFQTSSTSGESSILGTIGANSTTSAETVILPETEFKEHGYLIICAVHKLQNVYDSVYFKPRSIFKKSRFDFYTPELNDLGYQKSMDEESPLGTFFNEAFAEYRYTFNKSHGKLANEFPYWAPAISSEYASLSTIYKEAPGILDKALSVRSSTAPQFYDAWGFEEKCSKPMSLHSIPGMDGVI